MIVGMDFGTTNSGMAVYDGQAVDVLPLDPANPNPRVLRTAVYVTNEQAIHIGRTAVNHYFAQNIGRAVKMKRVWVGELEVYAEDMYYVTDAYVWVDVLSPGRLFLSVKTSLRDENYPGTVVGQNYYSLENLIALYMTAVKIRAEKYLGRELNQVVLGRPVRFAADPEHDRLAQSRLLQAAFRAGYEQVYLQPEPIAAAYSYETTLDKEQRVLVFDFGGGTLDLTVMRLGDAKRRQVLATGGIPVAGDIFDQKLVRAKLPRHFGEGSFYGARHKRLTMPPWIYDTFANWQTILELQGAKNRQMLTEIAQSAQKRYQIEALLSLVSGNYGLKMFDMIEQAKRRLSEKRGAELFLEGPGFKVRDFVTRTEFERMIGAEIRAIEQHLDAVIAESGLKPAQIDAVIRTGGSSQIPVFYEMLARRFGAEKVRTVDTFSSVTAGLGIMAHGIEAGEIEARPYTPDDVQQQDSAHKSKVLPVNLAVLQRRILMDEGAGGSDGGDSLRTPGLVLIGREGVTAVPFTQKTSREDMKPIARLGKSGIERSSAELPSRFTQETIGANGDWIGAIVADFDEQLLLITTHYRFILMTPRQLAELERMDLTLADRHHLERQEQVCAVSRWADIIAKPKLLLITSLGMARPYPTAVMRENIEVPVPLRFDHPLPGVVVAALGADETDGLIMVTQNRRGARWPLKKLRLSGTQAINCGKDDRVVAAALVSDESEIGLVTADGYGRRLRAEWVPIPLKPNQKGKALIARRGKLAAILTEPGWLTTSAGLVWGEYGRLPLENATKSQQLLKLAEDERIQCSVSSKQ